MDELVDINGVHLHVRCVGSGDTTVLLLSGFEVGDENWGNVEPDLAAHARVCSYARPGTGTSDQAVSTQSFTTQTEQLSALLTTIGEPGPYVVVGHSFGGAEAVTFSLPLRRPGHWTRAHRRQPGLVAQRAVRGRR